MNENTSIQLAGTASAIALPAGMNLTTRKVGKTTGSRLEFGADNGKGGVNTFASLRAEGKRQGLKGVKLTNWVNAGMRPSAGNRWVQFNALTSALQSAGFEPTHVDPSKGGVSIKLAKPLVDSAAKVAKVNEELKAEAERAMAELAAIRAELAAAKAAIATMTPAQINAAV